MVRHGGSAELEQVRGGLARLRRRACGSDLIHLARPCRICRTAAPRGSAAQRPCRICAACKAHRTARARDRNEIPCSNRLTFVSTWRGAVLARGSAIIILVAGLTGCDGSSHPTGTIVGTAEPCIGPYIQNAHYTVEYVSVSNSGGTVARQSNLTSPYKFAFAVPPGTYQWQPRRCARPGPGEGRRNSGGQASQRVPMICRTSYCRHGLSSMRWNRAGAHCTWLLAVHDPSYPHAPSTRVIGPAPHMVGDSIVCGERYQEGGGGTGGAVCHRVRNVRYRNLHPMPATLLRSAWTTRQQSADVRSLPSGPKGESCRRSGRVEETERLNSVQRLDCCGTSRTPASQPADQGPRLGGPLPASEAVRHAWKKIVAAALIPTDLYRAKVLVKPVAWVSRSAYGSVVEELGPVWAAGE